MSVRVTLTVSILFSVILCFFSFCSVVDSATTSTLTIGVTYSLVGQYASIGKASRDALTFCQGEKKHKQQLITTMHKLENIR